MTRKNWDQGEAPNLFIFEYFFWFASIWARNERMSWKPLQHCFKLL